MMPVVEKTERLILVNLIDLLDENYPTNYRAWFSDRSVTRYNSHGLFPYTQEAQKAFMQSLRDNTAVVWGLLAGGKHIGNITLQRINWIYRSAEMAIVIGEKDCWGAGYATEALTALYDHGFNRMNLRRIWSGTAATNEGMRAVFVKLGMKEEGVFREAMFLNGYWTDVLEYAIIEDEWRERNGKSQNTNECSTREE